MPDKLPDGEANATESPTALPYRRALRQTVELRDETQRDALRPFLEETDRRNRAILEDTRDQLCEAMVEMQIDLESLLSKDQRERLERFVRVPTGRSAPGTASTERPPRF